MSMTTAASIELPEGYTATERIGSGGYGEVWRATAPGGVEKAVKVVYGHCSEDLAERELKSLERIRSVRHPFVISLERFEVIGGRLIIITELADMSLDECFRRYQEKGERGIPREELLSYLRDAADALDCLVERHGLQHLDIKPENLLVVGDHVKVGDFGLVKELATRTLHSMMGGMTPLYSAPEVFDDTPSPRSDQYSLAIVFQQMLTGQLPFPGRTPAQLAKQHTQAEPNLQPLDEQDRKILRRALAKKPEARFASCREFVSALVTGSLPAPSQPAKSSQTTTTNASIRADDDTKSCASLHTQPLHQQPAQNGVSAATQVLGQFRDTASPEDVAEELTYPTVDEEVTEIAPPAVDTANATAVPTVVVATGGLGITMLNIMRRHIGEADAERLSGNKLAWLAIDTDRETLNAAATENGPATLAVSDTLHIPLKRPKQYREESQNLLRWVSRRWLYNIPRSLETRGYRPLGRIAAVDHAETILRSLYIRLQQLKIANPKVDKLRVLLLAGSGGATGSGIIVDLAQAVRSLANDLGIRVVVEAILAMPERAPGCADSLSIANSYCLLTEVTHVQRRGNLGDSPPPGPAARFEADAPAFDDVYLVCIPPRSENERRIQTFCSIAEYLALNATTPAATMLAACRNSGTSTDFSLRSFACTQITGEQSVDKLLERANTNVLACGHRRMTLLFSSGDGELTRRLQEKRPTIKAFEAADSALLVSEASDINPLWIVARLAEHFPDIADVAHRLHTRSDIEWQDLRTDPPGH